VRGGPGTAPGPVRDNMPADPVSVKDKIQCKTGHFIFCFSRALRSCPGRRFVNSETFRWDKAKISYQLSVSGGGGVRIFLACLSSFWGKAYEPFDAFRLLPLLQRSLLH